MENENGKIKIEDYYKFKEFNEKVAKLILETNISMDDIVLSLCSILGAVAAHVTPKDRDKKDAIIYCVDDMRDMILMCASNVLHQKEENKKL